MLEAAKELFVTKGFEATSVDDIARVSETSKGAVYHHFSDKREIFAEVFRGTQTAIMESAIEAAAGEPWDRVQTATRSFLRTYAADDAARVLLRQAIEVLGWNRVRALDEETALPHLRAILDEFTQAGAIVAVPPETTAELLFCLYCDAVLLIAADDTDTTEASRNVETVISPCSAACGAGVLPARRSTGKYRRDGRTATVNGNGATTVVLLQKAPVAEDDML